MRTRARCILLGMVAAVGFAAFFVSGCTKRRTRTVTREVSCTSVNPSFGRTTGGTAVTIGGDGFQPGAIVRFGQGDASGVAVNAGGKEITCLTPPGPQGWVDVIVWNPDGVGCRILDGFGYVLLPPPPRITDVSYVDVNANCLVDAGDNLGVTFSGNVTFTVSAPDQAFQLPVPGDSFGVGAQFPGGTPRDVQTATVVLGATAVLNVAGSFDFGALLPGSPSGLDVGVVAGVIVDALFPSVSAVSSSPPGLDIAGPGAIWTSVGDDQANSRFGNSVSLAGDVNGDGFGDVIVGCPRFNTTVSGAGKAYLYLGSAMGLATSPAWTSSGDDIEYDNFGLWVAAGGDVNGDGYGDVLVAADNHINPDSRKAYLFLGGASGLEASPAWKSLGDDQSGARFGHDLSSAGDVNGDGYDDVIVGAPWFDTTLTDAGKAYLFLGEPGGLTSTATWTSSGDDQQKALYGVSVASAGDVNGDGYSDVIVGASGFDTGVRPDLDQGKVYLYLGGGGGLPVGPDWTSSGDDVRGSFFGSALSSGGDVDADGFSDVVVAALGQRKTFLFLGSASGLASSPAWTSEGDGELGERFGVSVASAGDLNGDGLDDVIIGAAEELYTGNPHPGKVYVFLGEASGLDVVPAWTASGAEFGGVEFGTTVSSAGDVNGDGLPEVIVGDHLFDTTEEQAGKAFLFCVRP